MTPLGNFGRASAAVLDLVARIRDDQRALPTACVEWDLRAVVNHLAHGGAPRRPTGWAAFLGRKAVRGCGPPDRHRSASCPPDHA